MMEILSSKALDQKEKYGMVFLTENGRELAVRYSTHYEIIIRFLCREFALPREDVGNAVFALLAGLSDERIGSMCEIMRNMS